MTDRTVSRGRAFRSNSRSRRFRRKRGVSDVIATILILALTVTLFASIFAFVGSFPSPPPQNVSQFQAAIVRTANNTYISGVTIEHLSGPTISGSNHVYLESANHVSDWQFSLSTGIPIYWGLSGNSSSNVWNFGQTWSTTFNHLIKVPDNITVYIVTPTQLLYSVTLPGLTITTPPSIQTAGTWPTNIGTSKTFEIYATLGGTLTGLVDKVNLAGIPGLSGNYTLTKAANGTYVYTTTSGASTAGRWYAVLYVSNSLGQTASASIPVVVTSTGGGGTASQLSVTVGMSIQAPSYPAAQSPSVYFFATVTYTGSTAGASVYLNFTVNEFVGGKLKATDVKTAVPGTGNTPIAISGPSSVTIYSASTYTFTWISNSTVTVYGNATVTKSVGTATGSIYFPIKKVFAGIVFFTTSTSNPTLSSNIQHSFSHSCGGSCPYLYVDLWNNYTTALGGPSSVSFSGTVTTNTSGSSGKTYTIGATTVNQGASTLFSLITSSGNPARWTTPSGTARGAFTVKMWLTISSGGVAIGYIYDTFSVTLT